VIRNLSRHPQGDLGTARTLGIVVPPQLLAITDDGIE
jgi:hypothetical protein